MGLVEGYESINLPLAKPQLRANLEKDLQLICDGVKQPADVLREQIRIHREAFEKIMERAATIDATLANRLQEQPVDSPEPQRTNQFQEVHRCPRCSSMIALKTTADNRSMLTCLGYPACKYSMWIPVQYFKEAVVTDEVCQNCGPGFKKIKLKLKGMHLASFLNANRLEGLNYVTCVACDRSLKDLCGQDERPNNNNTTVNRQGNNATVADTSSNNGYINPNASNQRNAQNTSRGSGNQNTSRNARNSDAPAARGNVSNNTTNRSDGNSRPSNRKSPEVKCPNCGKVLTPLTVVSDANGNAGRLYYKCCYYFKFEDELTASSTSTSIGLMQIFKNFRR